MDKEKPDTAMPGRHFSLCTEKSLSGIFLRRAGRTGGKEEKDEIEKKGTVSDAGSPPAWRVQL